MGSSSPAYRMEGASGNWWLISRQTPSETAEYIWEITALRASPRFSWRDTKDCRKSRLQYIERAFPECRQCEWIPEQGDFALNFSVVDFLAKGSLHVFTSSVSCSMSYQSFPFNYLPYCGWFQTLHSAERLHGTTPVAYIARFWCCIKRSNAWQSLTTFYPQWQCVI